MYFLSDEERRYLLRKLLPESRRSEVHRDLRGWNWGEPPLLPVYEAPLGVAEVAGRYCATGRDLYMRRVVGVSASPTAAMLEGSLLHRAATEQLLRAIRTVYENPVDEVLSALEKSRAMAVEDAGQTGLPESCREQVRKKMSALAEFLHLRISAQIAGVLAKQPRVNPGGLAALALPAIAELPLDGRFLGLSSHLSVDSLALFVPMVMDLKFGPRRDFHRLATAGYALVMESLHECPVDIGCVTYVEIEGSRVKLQRDLHLIDDELRQWFIETRDEMMRLVSEEIDPGKPEECDTGCMYLACCSEHETPGVRSPGSLVGKTGR